MTFIQETLTHLYQKIKDREHRTPIPFNGLMELTAKNPDLVLRNIFQMMYDMINSHVGEGKEEYPDDPESINYVYYDCTSLFVEGVDHPFFADRLFANRMVNHVASFRSGSQQNRIYIFEGPHGCGKSTFLNNLLLKFEQYTNTEEGAAYETLWRLDKKELGVLTENETHALFAQLRALAEDSPLGPHKAQRDSLFTPGNKDYLEIPCPSHDNPMLLVPKAYRKEMLDDLIPDERFKEKLFSEKQYEWVFRDSPCTVCMSLYHALLDILGSPTKVFEMLYARRYQFNRRLGEGISVFNPGDRVTKVGAMSNQLLQNQLNSILKDSNRVRYIFSRYAKTNNGIYALMDVKAHNKERFANLHGIISEGVHKVEDIEENVKSLFLAIMNPEDRTNTTDTQSFSDRITYIKIPYVLDYNTEVKIYKNVFGDQIEKNFLPRVLQNMAKVIISSRLNTSSEAMKEWIKDSEKYKQYCDQNLQLLKMDIYGGVIPTWLTEDDRKRFTSKRRARIISESELEGEKGFSGRDSITIFNDFYSTYAKKDKLINMAMVCTFFEKHLGDAGGSVPEGFLDSLIRSYNYTVLQEVKESLYYYNEEQIARDIKNYLFAVNFEVGTVEKCVYTGEALEITDEFFENIERRILGSNGDWKNRHVFRKDIQKQYASKTLTQDMLIHGKEITETEVYQSLHDRYVYNLKEKVLDPFLRNENFRRAIKDYTTESFRTYDKRIREEVTFLMGNLNKKYGYSELGAKEVCIYVIDNDLAKTFSG